jgi:hypothetical protein
MSGGEIQTNTPAEPSADDSARRDPRETAAATIRSHWTLAAIVFVLLAVIHTWLLAIGARQDLRLYRLR